MDDRESPLRTEIDPDSRRVYDLCAYFAKAILDNVDPNNLPFKDETILYCFARMGTMASLWVHPEGHEDQAAQILDELNQLAASHDPKIIEFISSHIPNPMKNVDVIRTLNAAGCTHLATLCTKAMTRNHALPATLFQFKDTPGYGL